jgi:mannan endo-1,4-beta-mannosidase
LGFFFFVVVKGLDFVVSEAGKFGVKLILSLVNNYDSFGGKKQYVDWARSQGQSISSDDGFFSNSLVKQYYKNHIKVNLIYFVDLANSYLYTSRS